MAEDKKYHQSDTLQEYIDWPNIMKMKRYAGGHDEQMRGLFKDAEVLGHWNEGDYQGMVATCVKLNGKFIVYNDYYGSCSGCDAWEDSSDEEVRRLCIGLANSAYIFDSLEDVKEYLEANEKNEEWSSWANPAKGLLVEINKQQHV